MRNPRPKKRYPRSFLRKLQVLTEAQAGIVVAKLLCAAAIEVSMFLSGDIAAEGPAAIGGYAPSFTKKKTCHGFCSDFHSHILKGEQRFLAFAPQLYIQSRDLRDLRGGTLTS